MDILKIDRSFGVKLAAGEISSPGVLINVDSSGTGRIASDTNSYYAHGIALTSGAGTKTTGISQYVNCYRSATVDDVGVTLTVGAVVYMCNTGQYQSAAPGTINQKVGFALAAGTVFVDLDVPAA
jgi:hypothetical protein